MLPTEMTIIWQLSQPFFKRTQFRVLRASKISRWKLPSSSRKLENGLAKAENKVKKGSWCNFGGDDIKNNWRPLVEVAKKKPFSCWLWRSNSLVLYAKAAITPLLASLMLLQLELPLLLVNWSWKVVNRLSPSSPWKNLN